MWTYPYGELALVIDCLDLQRSADFWSAILGYEPVGRPAGRYYSLLPREHPGPELLLQLVTEPKTVKARLHLDLRTRDLAVELRRVLAAGATLVAAQPLHEGGWTWYVLADPDANEFCVLQPPDNHWPTADS